MERDRVLEFNSKQYRISTHTLTWSVTVGALFNEKEWEISTHTLTWSVTGNSAYRRRAGGHFNSHAHVERDDYCFFNTGLEMNFNSHAHVERDCRLENTSAQNLHFNSHAHVERDKLPLRISFAGTISTHTLTWSVTQTHINRRRFV